MSKIVIKIEDGIVNLVSGVPAGTEVEVHDYDIGDSTNLYRDKEGEEYIMQDPYIISNLEKEENLSVKQKEDYIKRGAAGCPKCKDSNVSSNTPIESDSNNAYQKCTCHDCGFEFVDIFTFSDVTEQE